MGFTHRLVGLSGHGTCQIRSESETHRCRLSLLDFVILLYYLHALQLKSLAHVRSLLRVKLGGLALPTLSKDATTLSVTIDGIDKTRELSRLINDGRLLDKPSRVGTATP